MIQYDLNREEILNIIQQFDALRLEPTASKQAILSSFRQMASECHPDKATTLEKRILFEERFKQLVATRDYLLEAIEISDLLFQISNFSKLAVNFEPEKNTRPLDHNPLGTKATKEERVEDEWKQFVSNQAVYFSLVEGAGITISSAIALSISSFFFGIILSTIICLVIWGLVAIFSASVAIPIAGWAFGLYAIYWLTTKLSELIEKVKRYTLESLSTTGYPLNTFVVGWVSINFIIMALHSFFEGWLILILIVQILGYWLLYIVVKDALSNMQSAMERIRSATNNSIIIVRAQNRFEK